MAAGTEAGLAGEGAAGGALTEAGGLPDITAVGVLASFGVAS